MQKELILNNIDKFCKFNFIENRNIVVKFLEKAKEYFEIDNDNYFLELIYEGVKYSPQTAIDIIIFFEEYVFEYDFNKKFTFEDFINEIVIKLACKGIYGSIAGKQLRRYLQKYNNRLN